jgi:aspartate/methionine/tyrosine aminotransferase
VDWEALSRALPKVAVALVANPANPTGLVLTPEDLIRLHGLCAQHGVFLIVDEVYRDFIWEGECVSMLSLARSLDDVAVLRSFSKNLGLAGWRVGFAVTGPQRRAAMTHVHDALYVGAPALPQVVLATLLSEFRSEVEAFVRSLIATYRVNRGMVRDIFQQIGMVPHPKSGAYYMLVAHGQESDKAAMRELLSRGVAVVPGVPFWRPGTKETGYLRLHFALDPSTIQELRKRLVRGDARDVIRRTREEFVGEVELAG